jgi:histidinol-phosphatase (PHP family)
LNFNLHTHTNYSDGSSSPEDYIKEAIRQGFDTLGFSDHAPVPFDNNFAIAKDKLQEYCDTISRLKTAYSSGLKIFLGLETDYIPLITVPTVEIGRNYPIDYFIGSVHLVKNGNHNARWFIDGPEIEIYDEGLISVFGGRIRDAVTAYYHQIMEMILSDQPDIIGHLDKVKMYNRNRYFREDEPWYEKLVDEVLDLVREKGLTVEVNTRGIYKKRSDSLFPGPGILKKINRLNIPVIISSDAHKPQEISLGFEEARKTLSELGFGSTWLKTAEGWKEIPLG